jgi:2-keto-4-pentenoate hydratase
MTSPRVSSSDTVEAGPPPTDDAVRAAAERLALAASTAVPCAPVRDLIGSTDVRAAYRVQSVLTARRLATGARAVGRKIGLTSPVVQRQLGVDQPDFGVLFDDMQIDDGGTIPVARLLQPRVEAEIAFVLAEDLASGPFDAEGVRSAVAYAVAAIEVVDSRVAGWDITFGDTVADNASSGLFVLGRERRTLDDLEPAEVSMTMTVDGGLESSGDGRACLGDPLNALAWLATTALELGDPLRAGEVVLSGALGPMHPLLPGSVVRADLSGLGSVAVRFSDDPILEEGP